MSSEQAYELTMERVHPSMVDPKIMLKIWKGKTEMFPFKPPGSYQVWMEHKKRYEFAKTTLTGGKILDISCGTGYGKQILGETFNYTGFDISAKALDEAKRLNKGGVFVNGDATSTLPFASKTFDNAVCFETIEHITLKSSFLSELARVTKPNGVILISTPNRNVFNPGKSIDDKPENKFHCFEFNKDEFLQTLNSEIPSAQEITLLGQGSVNTEDLSNRASNRARARRLMALVHNYFSKLRSLENFSQNEIPIYFLAKILV